MINRRLFSTLIGTNDLPLVVQPLKVPVDLEAKKKQVQDLVDKYSRMDRWLNIAEQDEDSHLTLHPRYIQMGHNLFIHKNQEDQGLKQVHQLTYRNIRDFQKGIESDDYQFYDDYPDCKEVLIVGSSNSGKSTLINELNDGIEVAKTSKRSGKTQSLNFYLCQKSEGKRRKHKDAELNVKRGMIIDSPGYGYTYAPRKVRDQWSRMMVSYLSYAIRLNLVIMLVNADLGLKACDIDMLTKLQHFNKRVQIVFTKIDKITAGSLQHNLELTSKRLQIYRNVYPEIYMLASVHGYGVKELRARIVTHF